LGLSKLSQKKKDEAAVLPELVPCSTPHLQILALIAIPEHREIGFIPDINDKPTSHAIGLDIGEELGEICIPTSPVPVITGVRSSGILGSIGAPKIVNKENEGCTIFASSLVI
jgi:hypothetical protein